MIESYLQLLEFDFPWPEKTPPDVMEKVAEARRLCLTDKPIAALPIIDELIERGFDPEVDRLLRMARIALHQSVPDAPPDTRYRRFLDLECDMDTPYHYRSPAHKIWRQFAYQLDRDVDPEERRDLVRYRELSRTIVATATSPGERFEALLSRVPLLADYSAFDAAVRDCSAVLADPEAPADVRGKALKYRILYSLGKEAAETRVSQLKELTVLPGAGPDAVNWAFLELAEVLCEGDRYGEATAPLAMVTVEDLDDEEDRDRYWVLRAEVAGSKRRWEDALASAEKAVGSRFREHHSAALFERVNALLGLGRPQEALADCNRLLEENFYQSSDVLPMRARAHEWLGDLKSAVTDLATVILGAADPATTDELHGKFAELSLKLPGDPAPLLRNRAEFAAALPSDSDEDWAKVLITRGVACLARRHKSEAKREFKAALSLAGITAETRADLERRISAIKRRGSDKGVHEPEASLAE
jgi:tetratricopeptide (TPR) repeat protein